jgi:hypothetical protein
MHKYFFYLNGSGTLTSMVIRLRIQAVCAIIRYVMVYFIVHIFMRYISIYIETANVYVKKYIIFKHCWFYIIFNLHEKLWNEITM